MKSSRVNKSRLLCKGILFFVVLSLLFSCSPSAATPKEQSQDGADGMWLYRDFSALEFTRENGEVTTLKAENPGLIVAVYWASWCPYCKTALENIDETLRIAGEENARLVLINKLDGEKESAQSANAYLAEHEISAENWMDDGLHSYNEIGMNVIPTVLVFDGQTRLMGVVEGRMPNAEELRSMLKNAAQGNPARVMNAVESIMVRGDGGVETISQPGVLSESQGLLMLAALGNGDADLYESLYRYVETHKTSAGLVSWQDNSTVNALIDDLRIYRAMKAYGINEQTLLAYSDAMFNGNVNNGRLVDFIDAENSVKATRFTLCYGDFEAMNLLSEIDGRWKKIYNDALSIVKGGIISEAFPLFHSWYDYETGMYKGGSLNMAEAMVTLLNLARIGELPAQSLEWLSNRMDEGYIYAVYDSDGRPNREGMYESTAVYAIIVQIAMEEGCMDLALKAVTRMEALRIRNGSIAADGAFGNADGSGFYSFDQLTALLAYQRLQEVTY